MVLPVEVSDVTYLCIHKWLVLSVYVSHQTSHVYVTRRQILLHGPQAAERSC